jgi:hypothetical protein
MYEFSYLEKNSFFDPYLKNRNFLTPDMTIHTQADIKKNSNRNPNLKLRCISEEYQAT